MSARCLSVFLAIAILLLAPAGCSTLPTTSPAPTAENLEPPRTALTPQAPGGTEFIEKSFNWSYWRFRDITWTWSARIPTSLYQHYTSKPRPSTENYAVYATDENDREIIDDLAHTLVGQAETLGLDDYETIHFIAAFVQHLAYKTDQETTGFDDYARYPIETLVEEGGDCEDTAILLGKIMVALDYDVVLVRLPAHIALGVLEEEKFAGTYYPYEDKHYFYLETTGEAGRIGMVPEEYKGQLAYIYNFSPRPVVVHSWTGQRRQDSYQLRVTVENQGTAAADGCSVVAGFDAGNERLWNRTQSGTFDLEPGDRVGITMTLSLPQKEHTRLLVYVVRNGKSLDKSHSEWFDS
jgi:predicted transglutaminase-like cysteine proteinase